MERFFDTNYIKRVEEKFHISINDGNMEFFIKYHLDDVLDSIIEGEYEFFSVFVNEIFTDYLHDMIYYKNYEFSNIQVEKILYVIAFIIWDKYTISVNSKNRFIDILLATRKEDLSFLLRLGLPLDMSCILIGNNTNLNSLYIKHKMFMCILTNSPYILNIDIIHKLLKRFRYDEFYILFNISIYESNVGDINISTGSVKHNISILLKAIFDTAEAMGVENIYAMLSTSNEDIRNKLILENAKCKEIAVHFDYYPNIKYVVDTRRREIKEIEDINTSTYFASLTLNNILV